MFDRQCEDCCCDSEEDMKPTPTQSDEPQSRFGRRLKRPRITSINRWEKVRMGVACYLATDYLSCDITDGVCLDHTHLMRYQDIVGN